MICITRTSIYSDFSTHLFHIHIAFKILRSNYLIDVYAICAHKLLTYLNHFVESFPGVYGKFHIMFVAYYILYTVNDVK